MLVTRFFASAAAAALLTCLPVASWAQDVHVITPKFPDSFKMRISMVSDDVEDSMGEIETSHTAMSASAEVQRSGEGYKAVYRIDKFDMDTVGPDGKPKTSAAEKAMMSTLIKAMGVAKVTLNANLEPLTVDNIDDIKASLKAMLTASGEADGQALYNLMVAGQTKESAAQLVRQSNKATSFYNIPLTLGTPVELPAATMDFMGASLRTRTVMTLTGWEDGKTARLRYVMSPTDEDLNSFVVGMMRGLVEQLAQGEDAKVQELMGRMADSTKARMVETCDVEVDLANPINYRAVCDGRTDMSIDMMVVMGANTDTSEPALMTMTETSHKVSETTVVP